jgi:hypothetical protein
VAERVAVDSERKRLKIPKRRHATVAPYPSHTPSAKVLGYSCTT